MYKELENALEWLKECGENDFLFETYYSKELYNYITNLQKENKELKSLYDTYELSIKNLTNRIDKAIEHLHKRYEQNNSALTNKEKTIISKHELLKLENINNKILEDILRGEDNESN